ncbi:hypothetical protein L873DRAFT_1672235, partial [Choiromyces venosus 120613-1]
LTSDTSYTGKNASTVIITITSPRAPPFVDKWLSDFSTTFRTEHHLWFNVFTQCSNCYHFGHYSNKCTNPSSCQWCTLPRSTRDHSCPTSTCHLRGHPCSYFTPRCFNCDGPHKSHSPACPSRPQHHDLSDEEELEEVVMVI